MVNRARHVIDVSELGDVSLGLHHQLRLIAVSEEVISVHHCRLRLVVEIQRLLLPYRRRLVIMANAASTHFDLHFIYSLVVRLPLFNYLAVFCPIIVVNLAVGAISGVVVDYFCWRLDLALDLGGVLPHVRERTGRLLHSRGIRRPRATTFLNR